MGGESFHDDELLCNNMITAGSNEEGKVAQPSVQCLHHFTCFTLSTLTCTSFAQVTELCTFGINGTDSKTNRDRLVKKKDKKIATVFVRIEF